MPLLFSLQLKKNTRLKKKAERVAGHLVIIGGAEDKYNERYILRQFLSLAGGDDAEILILPVASDFPEVAASVYTKIFRTLGAAKVTSFQAASRSDALELDVKKILDGVTGVFMTGGDQLRIASTLGGTAFSDLLEARVASGLVLGGTSAGAAGMSQSMIVRGEPTAEPMQNTIRLSPGLGILKNIIVDQHFTERQRLSRLISAVCYNPKSLGIGIDENTAAIVSGNGILEVVGSGTVTVVDGSEIGYTNIADVEPHAPFSVFGMKIHILSQGLRYDTGKRKPLEVFTEDLRH